MQVLKIFLLTLGMVFLPVVGCLPAYAAQNQTAAQIEASQLLLEVRTEAEALIAKYRSDPKFDKFKLELAEAKMARIRVFVDCQDGVSSMARSDIKGYFIALSLNDVRQTADRDCRVALAKLAAERWDDPWFNPSGKIALRYEMGAELSVLGDPSGASLMNEAEQMLTAKEEFNTLANAQFRLFHLYNNPKDRDRFFEGIVPILKKFGVFDSTKNGFLTLFAQFERCDLVDAVSGAGSCPKFKQWAKATYQENEVIQNFAKNLAQLTREIGIEQISTDKNGLKQALASQFPLGHMVMLASQARSVVAGR